MEANVPLNRFVLSFTRDPGHVHIMRKWEGDDPGMSNQKTPTALLLSPQREFHSFGFTARDCFHDLGPAEAAKWFYFDKFKMMLHHDKVRIRFYMRKHNANFNCNLGLGSMTYSSTG